MVKLRKRQVGRCPGLAAVPATCEAKFRGVRKRKWGKYVSEVRLPNSRERIWLGSFDSAEKAARAFDAALFLLRGTKAKFNFPNRLPDVAGQGIVDGSRLTHSEIQAAASKFANLDSEASWWTSSPHSSQATESESSDGLQTDQAEGCPLDDPIDFGKFPGIEDFPSDLFGMGMEGPVVEQQQGLSLDEFLTEEEGAFLWSY